MSVESTIKTLKLEKKDLASKLNNAMKTTGFFREDIPDLIAELVETTLSQRFPSGIVTPQDINSLAISILRELNYNEIADAYVDFAYEE